MSDTSSTDQHDNCELTTKTSALSISDKEKSYEEEDSGISTNGSKENTLESKTLIDQQEQFHKALVSEINNLFKDKEDPEMTPSKKRLSLFDSSQGDEIFSTPEQNVPLTKTAVMDWSESSCEVSEADLSTSKLEKIEEESSFGIDIESPVFSTETNYNNQPSSDLKSFTPEERDAVHILQPIEPYTFSQPLNLLLGDSIEKEVNQETEIAQSAEASSTTNEYQESCTQHNENSYGDEEEMDTTEDDPVPKSPITDSFADLLFKFSPRFWYHAMPIYHSPVHIETQDQSDPYGNDSVFSVSSLEDCLSPEIRPSTNSTSNISLDSSAEIDNARFLGIRLHKPSGLKDVYLSVISIDDEKGLETVSDTWTLGNREDMELILSIETNPHSSSTKQYCGRYSLVFNDKDLSVLNSNSNSFLPDNSSHEATLSPSQQECLDKLSTNGLGKLAWRVAIETHNHNSSLSRDSSINLHRETTDDNEAISGDESYQIERMECRKVVSRLSIMSRVSWVKEIDIGHGALAAGCAVLTCYVLYKLKC